MEALYENIDLINPMFIKFIKEENEKHENDPMELHIERANKLFRENKELFESARPQLEQELFENMKKFQSMNDELIVEGANDDEEEDDEDDEATSKAISKGTKKKSGALGALRKKRKTEAGEMVSTADEYQKPEDDGGEGEGDDKGGYVVPTDGEVDFEKLRKYGARVKGGSSEKDLKNPNHIINVIDRMYQIVIEENLRLKKLLPMSYIKIGDVRDLTAVYSFIDTPNVDLSMWNVSGVSNFEGLFYKSTFNNNSIAGWDVKNGQKFDNMFLCCPFDNDDIIDHQWQYGTDKNENPVKRPVIGTSFDAESGSLSAKKKKNPYSGWSKLNLESTKNNEYTNNMNEMKYIQSREDFINEAFGDGVKHIVKKVADAVRSTVKKLKNGILLFFGEDGKLIPAVSPITTANYANDNVKGVTVAIDTKSAGLEKKVDANDIKLSDGEYPNKWSERESQNYKTMIDMLKSAYDEEQAAIAEGREITPSFMVLNEDEQHKEQRVPLTSKGAGIGNVDDYDSVELKIELKKLLNNPALPSLLIWGAPGIGKSSIPRAIIEAWNEDNKGDYEATKALIEAQCGDMTVDGFALPIPKTKRLRDTGIDSKIKDKIDAIGGATADAILNSEVTEINDVPVTWLPVWRSATGKDADKVNQIRNDIANGRTTVTIGKDLSIKTVKSGGGGILMLDEFLRADPEIFKILMQLCLNKTMKNEWHLGTKWCIIACSNRPVDDKEVKRNFSEGFDTTKSNRFGQINFVPDFNDWCDWAKTKGGFDQLTLSYLSTETDSSNGEYTHWHNIDAAGKSANGETRYPTPRTWSMAMTDLRETRQAAGVMSIYDIPKNLFIKTCAKYIGNKEAESYYEYAEVHKDDFTFPYNEVLDNRDFAPNTEDKSFPTAYMFCDSMLSYIKSNFTAAKRPTKNNLTRLIKFVHKYYNDVKYNSWIIKMLTDIIEYLKISDMMGEVDGDDTTYEKFGALYKEWYVAKDDDNEKDDDEKDDE